MKASETVVDAMNACKRSHSAAQVTQITHALAGQSTWRTIKKRVKQDERMSDSDKKEETGDAQDNACGRRRLLCLAYLCEHANSKDNCLSLFGVTLRHASVQFVDTSKREPLPQGSSTLPSHRKDNLVQK